MKEQLLIKEITYLESDKLYPKLKLNQTSLSVLNGDLISLVGLENSGKEALLKVIAENKKINLGEIILNEDLKPNQIELLNFFDNSNSKKQTALDFITKNVSTKEYKRNLYHDEIEKLLDQNYSLRLQLKEIKSDEGYINKIKNEKRNFKISNESLIREEYFNSQEKLLLNKKELEEELDGLNKVIHGFKNETKKHIETIRLINAAQTADLQININNIVKKIKQLQEQERNEIKKTVYKSVPSEEQIAIAYPRMNSMLNSISKDISKIDLGGLEYSQKLENRLNRLSKKVNVNNIFKAIEELGKIIDHISLTVVANKINPIKANYKYLVSISDHKSAINTFSFDESFKYFEDLFKRRIEIVKNSITEIQDKLQINTNNDAKERNTSIRRIGEKERESLLYQLQIYKDRLEILKQMQNNLVAISWKHSADTIKDFYNVWTNYEYEILKLEITFNSWKLRSDIQLKEIELNEKKEEKEVRINAIKKRLHELEQKVITENNYENQLKIYSSTFDLRNEIYFSKKLHEGLSDSYKNDHEDMIEEIKSTIETNEKLISNLRSKINESNIDEVELESSYVFDVLGFNFMKINSKLTDFTKYEMYKLQICRSIIEDKKIILINLNNDLSFEEQIDFASILKDVNEKYGCTFIVATDNIQFVEEFSKTICFMEKGTIIETIKNQKNVVSKIVNPQTKLIINKLDLTKENVESIIPSSVEFTIMQEIMIDDDHMVKTPLRNINKIINK